MSTFCHLFCFWSIACISPYFAQNLPKSSRVYNAWHACCPMLLILPLFCLKLCGQNMDIPTTYKYFNLLPASTTLLHTSMYHLLPASTTLLRTSMYHLLPASTTLLYCAQVCTTYCLPVQCYSTAYKYVPLTACQYYSTAY